MFRLETRYIIFIAMVVIWTMPIYVLIKYSLEYNSIQRSEADLKKTLSEVQTKLEALEEQLEFMKQNKISKGNIIRDLRSVHSSLIDVNHPRKVNLFIETSGNQKQFYRKYGARQYDELYDIVEKLPSNKRKRVLVTGGAGFVGGHLVDSLMLDGHEVIVCDNFHTGRRSNIQHWLGHPNFELKTHDVIEPLNVEVNEIYHLASPASPVHYMSDPVKTIKTNTIGTINMLELAKNVGAKFLLASTSEVYGDPELHPQSETYWGHANPIGPRSCYDESKRVSESLAIAYKSRDNVSISIARIFNTYGPRMHPNDGRVVSNFVIQSISNKSMTVYGTGKQTRSFQFVTDLVQGLKKLMASSVTTPVNLGNPSEMTIHSLALQVKNLVPYSSSDILFLKLPTDDPNRRRPDIRKAMTSLNWWPIVDLSEGLNRTIEYFKQEVEVT